MSSPSEYPTPLPPSQCELKPQRKTHLSRLALDGLTTLGDTLEERLTVLVEVELGDDDVGGGDAEGNALAVGLLTDNTLNVHNVLETVDGGDLAFPALGGTSGNENFVLAADGERADLLEDWVRFVHMVSGAIWDCPPVACIVIPSSLPKFLPVHVRWCGC